MHQGTPLILRPEALEAAKTGKRVVTEFKRYGERYAWVFYPNGLQVLFEVRKLPFVHFKIAIRTGAFDDGIAGEAHALEHMLVKDPLIEGDHPALQKLAPHGLEVNASTGYDVVDLYGKTAYRKWRELLNGFLQMMFSAHTIDERRWLAERPAIEQEIRSTDEAALLQNKLRVLLNPHVPQIHHRPFGTRESVLKLGANVLRERYDRDFHPENAVIVVHGMADYERFLRHLESNIPTLTPRSRRSKPGRAPLPLLSKFTNTTLKFKGSPSVERVIGHTKFVEDPSGTNLEAARIVLMCLNEGGILRDTLRRKHGWTYNQNATLWTWPMDVISITFVAKMRAEFHPHATQVLRDLWHSTCERLGKQGTDHRYALDRARGEHALRYMQRRLNKSALSVDFLTGAWLEQALPQHRPFIDVPPEEFPAIARRAPELADLEWHMISVVRDI